MQNDSEADVLLRHLLEGTSSEALAWVNALRKHQISAPANFKWLTLAEATLGNVYHASGSVESSEWACLALFAFELLRRTSSSSSKRFSSVCSIMNLRAWMIEHYGAVPSDPVRDVRDIIDLFWHNVPMSYPDAMQLMDAESRPIDLSEFKQSELQTLRNIKNLLAPIASLDRKGYIPQDAGLYDWLALHDHLP